MSAKKSKPLFRLDDYGATAVVFALGIACLAGIWALSVDLGRAWNLGTQLQEAADASALICASQLDQEVDARVRATAAATADLVKNIQSFTGGDKEINISASNITFYSNLVSKTIASSDVDARFCEIKVSPRAVNTIFAGLLSDHTTISPRARAVAQNSTAHCRIPPVIICNPNEPGPFDPEVLHGRGITLKSQGASAPLAAGNFGLLALPAEKVASLSTNDIRDAWARVRPLDDCFGETVTTKPGQSTAIAQGLNMRFDIFFQGTHVVPSGELPVRDNPNYTPSLNDIKGLKPGINCSATHPQGWTKTPTPYDGAAPKPQPSYGVDAMGFPRDDCAYGGTCDISLGGSNIGDGAWAYAKYMEINHPTMAPPSLPVPPIPDLDGDTSGTPSRYEVYKWELSNALSQSPPENAPPMCHNAAWQPDLDRRVISAAVVNCGSLGGSTIIKPISYVDLFLTEPMGIFDTNNDLYAEIIGPSDQGNDEVVWHILRLVE